MGLVQGICVPCPCQVNAEGLLHSPSDLQKTWGKNELFISVGLSYACHLQAPPLSPTASARKLHEYLPNEVTLGVGCGRVPLLRWIYFSPMHTQLVCKRDPFVTPHAAPIFVLSASVTSTKKQILRFYQRGLFNCEQIEGRSPNTALFCNKNMFEKTCLRFSF